MAIRFGSDSGFQTRTDYRVSESELDCGTVVHLFIRNIEKSYSFTDEISLCNIGVIGSSNDEVDQCFENTSMRISEEASPKYKPTDEALGVTAEELAQLAQKGIASTKLACVPLKIKSVTVEVSASYREMDRDPSVEDILQSTTSDGLVTLGEFFTLPDNGTYILTSKSTDSPMDNFGTRSITYRKKIAYPTTQARDVYLGGVEQYFSGSGGGDSFNKDESTVEREAQLRQGEVPSQTVSVTRYGVPDVTSAL